MACRDKLIYDIGTIKLADFGLSKSLPINKHVAFDLDDTYRLTGETGSYRYMVRPRASLTRQPCTCFQHRLRLHAARLAEIDRWMVYSHCRLSAILAT